MILFNDGDNGDVSVNHADDDDDDDDNHNDGEDDTFCEADQVNLFWPAGQLKSSANSGMLLRGTFTLHGGGK